MNSVIVNGRDYKIDDSLMDKKLIDFLREDLELTGTKNGCAIGACGACTVLVDNTAKKSCIVLMERVIGKSIVTIEGLEDRDGTLHPMQQAFVDAGAIQCGFCTPGMILKGISLLNKTPNPTRFEIRKAFNGNLCRCTGYQQIIDAVELASSRI